MRQRVCLFRFGITYRQSPPGQFYTHDVIDIHRDRVLTFHRFLSFQMYHTNKRINELKWVHRFKCISCKIVAIVDICVDSIIMACGYNLENSSSKNKKKKNEHRGYSFVQLMPVVKFDCYALYFVPSCVWHCTEEGGEGGYFTWCLGLITRPQSISYIRRFINN